MHCRYISVHTYIPRFAGEQASLIKPYRDTEPGKSYISSMFPGAQERT